MIIFQIFYIYSCDPVQCKHMCIYKKIANWKLFSASNIYVLSLDKKSCQDNCSSYSHLLWPASQDDRCWPRAWRCRVTAAPPPLTAALAAVGAQRAGNRWLDDCCRSSRRRTAWITRLSTATWEATETIRAPALVQGSDSRMIRRKHFHEISFNVRFSFQYVRF